jgi:hypothetical protein
MSRVIGSVVLCSVVIGWSSAGRRVPGATAPCAAVQELRRLHLMFKQIRRLMFRD